MCQHSLSIQNDCLPFSKSNNITDIKVMTQAHHFESINFRLYPLDKLLLISHIDVRKVQLYVKMFNSCLQGVETS